MSLLILECSRDQLMSIGRTQPVVPCRLSHWKQRILGVLPQCMSSCDVDARSRFPILYLTAFCCPNGLHTKWFQGLQMNTHSIVPLQELPTQQSPNTYFITMARTHDSAVMKHQKEQQDNKSWPNIPNLQGRMQNLLLGIPISALHKTLS